MSLWNEEMNQQMWLFLHLHRNKNHVNDQQSWNQINLTSSYSHNQIPTCLTKHSQVVEEAGFTWLYSPSPPRSLSQRLPLATGNSRDLTSSDRNSHFETHRIWSSPRLAIAGINLASTPSVCNHGYCLNWIKLIQRPQDVLRQCTQRDSGSRSVRAWPRAPRFWPGVLNWRYPGVHRTVLPQGTSDCL